MSESAAQEYPLSPNTPEWLSLWHKSWRSGIASTMRYDTTKVTNLVAGNQPASPWWLPGIASSLVEPRTLKSDFGVFGHLWIRKNDLENTVNLVLMLSVGEGFLMSLASLQIENPEALAHVAQAATEGLEDAMEWLTLSDPKRMREWATGGEPLFRRLAESSPHSPDSVRVYGYLNNSNSTALSFPLPPATAFRCSKGYISKSLCVSVLASGASIKSGLPPLQRILSPLQDGRAIPSLE